MRFDDRLNTVLAQPATNPHDRAVRWRQLVELLARASDLSSPLAERALDAIRQEATGVNEQLRAAAARAIARPHLPLELVAAFAADTITVAAPILAAASLSPEDWQMVLARASDDCRQFIRSLHPDVREAEASPEPEEAPHAAETPRPSLPPRELPSIAEVLARIERFRHDRPSPPLTPAPQAQDRAQTEAKGPESAPALFRWECGPSGEIAWVEGAPRGAFVGRSLANPGEHNGLDERIQRAFAQRAPFREASLIVSGEGIAAGEWKLSGVPAFEPMDGRFAGYRGVAQRAGAAEETAEERTAERKPLDDDALRELVHELKTPLNAIIGFAEIIQGQYLGPAEEAYRQRAGEIVAQAQVLLSAIEDLDLAAQLRSRGGGAGTASLNDALTDLLPELEDRASRRAVQFELRLSRRPSECAVEPVVLERLIRRFCGALIDAAASNERVAVTATCNVGQCILAANRLAKMRGMVERELFAPDQAATEMFVASLSLKLARGIAQTVGGDLRLAPGQIVLVLPRQRS